MTKIIGYMAPRLYICKSDYAREIDIDSAIIPLKLIQIEIQ